MVRMRRLEGEEVNESKGSAHMYDATLSYKEIKDVKAFERIGKMNLGRLYWLNRWHLLHV